MLLIPRKDCTSAAKTLAEALRHGPVQLLFVCTHNSRRSQLSEALAAAEWAESAEIEVRSCGTEKTACHPSTVQALADLGWSATELGEGTVWVNKGDVQRTLYSKTLDEVPRDRPIVALMTCAEADEACPAIPGAVARIPWRYPDPKFSDGQPECRATYRAVAEAIARDLHELNLELQKLR